MKNNRRYWTLWRYIAKEFLLSFLVGFLFFFIIFFINQLLLMAEDILSKNVPVVDVIKLVVYAMPTYIAMSFPFGSLVGALMSAGRLSSESELLVMRASGVKNSTILVPFIVFGALIALGSFLINDILLPIGTINYSKLYRKLLTKAPALELKAYSVKKYKGTTIVTGKMDNDVIYDMIILDTPESGKSRVINAESAVLLDKGESSGQISLILTDVFVQESDIKNPNRFEYSTAKKMEYNILIANFMDISNSISPREMSSVDVARDIREKQATLNSRIKKRNEEVFNKQSLLLEKYFVDSENSNNTDRVLEKSVKLSEEIVELKNKPIKDRILDIYRLEYEKKFSIPAGAFFFVFLAFPLGAKAKKSGRAVGFGIGLLVAVAYWGLLLGGQTLGIRSDFDPWLSMWTANIFVIVSSIPLLLELRNK